MAVQNAKGEYLANLDADDLAHPARLERQIDYLLRSGEKFDCSESVVFCDINSVNWGSNLIADNGAVVNVTHELMKKNPISHLTVTMERDVLMSCGFYDDRRSILLDYDLWCRLAKCGVILNKQMLVLGAKRIHKNQSFENKKRIKYLLSSIHLQRDIIKHFDGGFKYQAYALARLPYGLLPQRLRVRLK